jgi:DNA-binding transcriptional ArsR family regulator
VNELQATKAFGALGHEVRLHLLRLLVEKGPEGMTPSQLTACLNMPAATLSFHLRELTQAGLISQTRQGRHLIYQPALQTMTELIQFLTSNCCQGQPCSLTTPSKTVACQKQKA